MRKKLLFAIIDIENREVIDKHMEKLIKKQVTLSIFSFVLISLVVIGTSSALLRGIATTDSYESKTGELAVEFSNGDTINLTTDPIEDETAISDINNIYNFKVINSGSDDTLNVPYTYRVFLTTDSVSAIDARFVKYCLVESEDGEDVSTTAFTTSNCTPTQISTTSSFSKIEIATKENLTTTTSQNSKSYRLKVWLSNNYTDANGNIIFIPNSAIGKTMDLKIYICGQAGTSLEDLTSC